MLTNFEKRELSLRKFTTCTFLNTIFLARRGRSRTETHVRLHAKQFQNLFFFNERCSEVVVELSFESGAVRNEDHAERSSQCLNILLY